MIYLIYTIEKLWYTNILFNIRHCDILSQSMGDIRSLAGDWGEKRNGGVVARDSGGEHCPEKSPTWQVGRDFLIGMIHKSQQVLDILFSTSNAANLQVVSQIHSSMIVILMILPVDRVSFACTHFHIWVKLAENKVHSYCKVQKGAGSGFATIHLQPTLLWSDRPKERRLPGCTPNILRHGLRR